MPNPDYLGAAAWLASEMRQAEKPAETDAWAQRWLAHATLALSCVRAMQALASGKVHVAYYGYGEFTAWKDGRGGDQFTAPDPLTAITLALTEAGDA